MSDVKVYQLGGTMVPIGLSLTTQIIAPRGATDGFLSWQSGGTLALVNGPSMLTTAGYILKTTETLWLDGPATFFLSAAGSTALAGIVWKYSGGFSLVP